MSSRVFLELVGCHVISMESQRNNYVAKFTYLVLDPDLVLSWVFLASLGALSWSLGHLTCDVWCGGPELACCNHYGSIKKRLHVKHSLRLYKFNSD